MNNANRTRVIIYYLQMTAPDQLRPARRRHPTAQIGQVGAASPEFNRFLYASVGGDWYWRDRLSWTYDEWMTYLNRPEHETWVAYVEGTPAGYIELEHGRDNYVEIAYFGLLPQFIGQGLGGQLLTYGIQRAWDNGAAKVWVHTCTLDHPSALANYQARGLRIFQEHEKWILLPASPPGPWPGAQRPLMHPTIDLDQQASTSSG